MTHIEIRKKFLEFFKTKNHTIVKSDSLVPAGDPTVLFTGAGMNQFKEQFLGHTRGFTRAASCQRCLRTDDLKNVGVTSYHHTFFEMLGNFSFGDYFKEDAIFWAWEFMTGILKIPQDKLSISVYKDDDEAYDIWKNKIKLPEAKILKLTDKDNFWPSEAKQKGPNGPCGPCSEIFYEKEIEVWNLVFTQFNRKEGGVLEALPSKNIDTGMGLERLCAVMQQKDNNFETDLFTPIIDSIKHEVSGNNKKDIYAIADHLRAVAFSIYDGIIPSNEERGYVIRSLIRKSALHGRNLGAKRPFLYKIISSISNVMEIPYPGLKKRRDNISQIVLAEEEKFVSTLEEGLSRFEAEYQKLKAKSITEIPGDFAATLTGTFGFPFEIIVASAEERGFTVDKTTYYKIREQEREETRKKSTMHKAIFKMLIVKEKVEFIGYEKLESESKVLRIIKDAKVIQQLKEGETAQVVLDISPFYGESGGQAADKGILSSKNMKAKVLDAKTEAGAILLNVLVEKGILKEGDTVNAEVDKQRRLSIARNHTATHLLQSALRKVLGDHVQQQGSLVEENRLRFDFTHFKGLSQQELDRVEEVVNSMIQEKIPVCCNVMDIDTAKSEGALAFFGDKYDEKVRVISLGDYSKELCGGTHVSNTKEIGVFKIVSESSVASGIRRIGAVTGKQAQEMLAQEKVALKDICDILKCSGNDAPGKVKELIFEFDKLEKKIKQMALNKIRQSLDILISKSKKIDGIIFISSKIEGLDAAFLRNVVDMIKEKLKGQGWIALLGSLSNNQVGIILAAADTLTKKGFNSGKIISKITSLAGGSGGGKPDMAQGGIKDISKFDKVIDEGEKIITEELKK